MRLPKHSTIALPLLFIAILLPGLPLLGSDGTDESSTTSSPAPARLRMATDTLEQTDPRNCVSQAAEMANAENLAGYLECFAAGSQKKLRKEAALFFARHEVEMDLLDSHVIKEGPTKSELAVRYRAKLSDSQYDVISLVAVKKENGYWKISSEKVQEYECQTPRSCH
ncbi:MAG: hypothetical protein WCH40_09100, partial [Verrucomicrobiales bacterium]